MPNDAEQAFRQARNELSWYGKNLTCASEREDGLSWREAFEREIDELLEAHEAALRPTPPSREPTLDDITKAIAAADFDAVQNDTGANWESAAKAMTKHAESIQAKIDALMLEYCPDEMTPEQVKNWGIHQRPATPEQEVAVQMALQSERPASAAAQTATRAPMENCRYCGVPYPKPVSYHHSTDECRANEARISPDAIRIATGDLDALDTDELLDDAKVMANELVRLALTPSEIGTQDYKALYHELLFAVGNTWPGKTRHEIALHYIQQAERGDNRASQANPSPSGVEEV